MPIAKVFLLGLSTSDIAESVQEELIKKQVLAEWHTINLMAQKRFGMTSVADEAALNVVERLAADDWSRVKEYRGGSTFRNFIKILVSRLLEDFARHKFGRLRPPGWLQNLGGIWLMLFVALCQQRLNMVEAIEVVLNRTVEGTVSKDEIEAVGDELLSRIPQCGRHQYIETEYEENKQNDFTPAVPQPDSVTEDKEQKEIFSAIYQTVLGFESDVSRDFQQKYQTLSFDLNSEEKLLIKLCFQDGLDVTRAGKLLSLNRFQAHGKMRRLLKKLHSEFERAGFSDEFRSLISST